MYLGGRALRKLFIEGKWIARIKEEGKPLTEMEPKSRDKLIGPNSIDVTLGHTFKVPRMSGKTFLDPLSPVKSQDLSWMSHEGVIILQPQDFILGNVRESFVTRAKYKGKYFAQMYDGRSTLGRIGIGSHVTAGFGDYGFCGAFTLEIVNNAPYDIRLTPGMRIGQVYFVHVEEPLVYGGAYSMEQHAVEPIEPILGPDRF